MDSLLTRQQKSVERYVLADKVLSNDPRFLSNPGQKESRRFSRTTHSLYYPGHDSRRNRGILSGKNHRGHLSQPRADCCSPHIRQFLDDLRRKASPSFPAYGRNDVKRRDAHRDCSGHGPSSRRLPLRHYDYHRSFPGVPAGGRNPATDPQTNLSGFLQLATQDERGLATGAQTAATLLASALGVNPAARAPRRPSAKPSARRA